MQLKGILPALVTPFNAAGAVDHQTLADILEFQLAVGVKGLQLAGAPIWIPDLFNGIALLLAVGLAKTQAGNTRARAIRRVMSKQSADDGHAGRTAH